MQVPPVSTILVTTPPTSTRPSKMSAKVISTVASLRPVSGLVAGVSGLSEPPLEVLSSSLSTRLLSLSESSLGSVGWFSEVSGSFLDGALAFSDSLPMSMTRPQTARPARMTGMMTRQMLFRFLFWFFCFFIEVMSSLWFLC